MYVVKKIGIDGRSLSRQLTGIGHYTLSLCKALSSYENIDLFVYSPSQLLPGLFSSSDNITLREGNVNNSFLKQVWCETKMPQLANKDGVDVFWGASHRLPGFLSENISKVVTIHDLVWKYAAETMRKHSQLLDKFLMPLAIKRADGVFAVSISTANDVKNEFNLDGKSLSIVSPASSFSEALVSERAIQKRGITRPYFLFVGTIEPRKNLQRLLKAFARLPKTTKEMAMLVIVGGEGWGGVNIKQQLRELDIEGDVCLLDCLSQVELAGLYTGALFLAMPSIYEGFGLPIVEAMSCGIPAMVANNSSMPEVAGDAAVLVNANSVSSIQKGLESLITDTQSRDKLAGRAKKNAARYDWQRSAQELLTVFNNVVSKRREQ